MHQSSTKPLLSFACEDSAAARRVVGVEHVCPGSSRATPRFAEEHVESKVPLT